MLRGELRIRQATQDDVSAMTVLLSQLGYDLEPAEVLRRLYAVSRLHRPRPVCRRIVRSGDRLLHVFERPAMEKPPEAVVQALVVDADYRGTGAGRALMQFAEAWAGRRGLASVCLSSHADRDDAHGFYDRLGYRRIAISHVLRRWIDV